jgi:hypothetical protein
MPEQLSLYESIDLFISATAQLDVIQNYWLSATFAVVLTAFLARNHLNFAVTFSISFSISFLYFLGSLLFLARSGLVADTLGFISKNSPSGLEPLMSTKMLETRPALVISRLSTYFLGFFAAQIYLWVAYRQNARDDSSN